MDHNSQDSIKAINGTLSHFGSAERYHSYDEKDAEKTWNASLFFFKLFLKSTNAEHLVTKADFNNFKQHYEDEYSLKIDLNSLFERFWLREILGFVYFPEAVRKVTYDYEKYQERKNELEFLKKLVAKYPSKEMDRKELTKAYDLYEKNNEIKLNKDWLESAKWIEQKKDRSSLRIGNIEYYYTLLKYWEDFTFLYAFKIKSYERKEGQFKIGTADLKKIIKEHKTYFQSTPNLESFTENGTLKKAGSGYSVELFNTEVSYWSNLNSEISGHYWESLLRDESFTDHRHRINHFLSMMLRGSQWPVLNEHISTQAKKIFLNTAVKIINKEPDIIGIKNEFKKCCLDQGLGSNYAFQFNKPLQDEPFLQTNNLLERYRQLQFISEKSQNNIFYVQESRNDLAFLVKMVVLLDREYDTVTENNQPKQVHYPNVKQLLRSGLEKPYLLWEVSHFLVDYKPSIIPYLLIEPDIASLGFHLLDTIKIHSQDNQLKSYLRLYTLENGLTLVLNSCFIQREVHKKDTALLVFQLYQDITKFKKDSVSRVRSVEERDRIITEREQRENKLLSIIEQSDLSGEFIRIGKKELLIPNILEELIEVIRDQRETSKHENGYISFSFTKVDYYCWLARFFLNNDSSVPTDKLKKYNSLLSEEFVTSYIEKIEQHKVFRRDFNSNKMIEALPSWGEKNERLAKIDWLSIVRILYVSEYLTEFLNPRFRLKRTTDIYDKKNEFEAKKIRTHFFILLSILKKISEEQNTLKDFKTKHFKIAVENKIAELVKKYGKPNLSHSQNILGQHLDRGHFRDLDDELLPFSIEMADLFEDKQTIFNLLINTDNLIQLLYLLSHSQTEGVIKKTLKKIQKIDIIDFLEKQHWRPDINYVVTELPKYPDLSEQNEIAFNFWDNLNKNNKNREISKSIFEAKLISAYYRKDEAAIQAVENPEEGYLISRELKPYDHKQFFVALVRYKENPEDAYIIFNRLVETYPEYATFALNRFGAKVNLGLKANKIEYFAEALKEWFTYEKTCSSSLLETVIETVIEKVNYNKLTSYLNLKNNEAFDKLYSSLTKLQIMSPDLVQLRVQMLVENDFINEARTLIDRALSFHKISNQDSFKFLKTLEDKIAKSNPLEEIKKQIGDLKITAQNSMSSFKPLKYDGDFGSQMANEILTASNRFLTNIKSYNPKADEDDYSNIIKEILENKLSTFGYHIKDQPKGGSSATGKKPGERDLVICDDTGDLSIIEAFKHSTKTVVQKHLTKIFNYTHRREVMYILAYDLNDHDLFEQRWKKYYSKTLKEIKYPQGFELDGQAIIDNTNDFNYPNTAIKICKSSHKNGTLIYHIMLNVSYLSD